MMRVLAMAMAVVFGFVGTASAQDLGTKWWTAWSKAKVRGAAAVTVKSGLKYGASGKDSVVATKVDRHLTQVHRKLRKLFKGANFSVSSCTNAGREMAYMAREWKETNAGLSDWIRAIPQKFCTGDTIQAPRVWLIKKMGDSLPHAILLFYTGDNDLINGFYHF
jgi:hypothetical protein